MSDRDEERLNGNLPGGASTLGISGTSSAKTTAKPLKQNPHQYDQQDTRRRYDERFQVPVDVAVEEPRAGVIGEEANCDKIPGVTQIHNIPNNGVVEIVRRATGATDDVEVMPVQMNRMLLRETIGINLTVFYCNSKILTGPPTAFEGMVNSTLLLRPRP